MSAQRIGVLLVNSGTPHAASAGAVRAFLARFLADPRVIELPRPLWLPVLYGAILPLRPLRAARKYRRIWSAGGSPLADLTAQLCAALGTALAARVAAPVSVAVGMLYSEPGVAAALSRLRAEGAHRVIVLPLFPQYCAATAAAALDQVGAALRRTRVVPDLQFVADYHDDPGYLGALRASIAEHWQAHGRTAHLLVSFHGIPRRYAESGDPYPQRCEDTARRLAAALELAPGQWSLAYQSRFGPAGWLTPDTAAVLAELPARGVREVTVVCPGFAVDCLETLEEIDIENRATFLQAGGERFEYVPALNARADHAQALAALIARRCAAWDAGG